MPSEITGRVMPGQITATAARDLRSALLELLRQAPAPLILIDLSAMSCLDKSGIEAFLKVLEDAGMRTPDRRQGKTSSL